MKIVLIVGAGIFVLGLILFFLSQATNQETGMPLYPLLFGEQRVAPVYLSGQDYMVIGTAQTIWALIVCLGLITALVGLIGVIVKVIKKPKQEQV